MSEIEHKEDTKAYMWVYGELEAILTMWDQTKDAYDLSESIECLMDGVGCRMYTCVKRDEEDAAE